MVGKEFVVIPPSFRLRWQQKNPSITARVVAITRGEIVRPKTPGGDRKAEDRLCRTLRPRIWLTPESRRHRLAARTRFIDSEVIAALADGVGQVVIVGAGYDCRALRLSKLGTSFFEVDHPVTQEDKKERLAALDIPLDDITYLPLDLAHTSLDVGLGRTDHRRQERTLFLCEGILMYLSTPAIRMLLGAISACAAPKSRLVLTARATVSRPHGWSLLSRLALSGVGEPMRSTFDKTDLLNLLGEYDCAPTREAVWPAEGGRRRTLMISAEFSDRLRFPTGRAAR
jgi:methyltransferase (TIGR00027 family)